MSDTVPQIKDKLSIVDVVSNYVKLDRAGTSLRAQEHIVREVLAITGVVNLFDKLGFKAFNKEKYALFRVLK